MAVEKAAEAAAAKGADAVDKIIPGGLGKKAMWLTGKAWKISTNKWTLMTLAAVATAGAVIDPVSVTTEFTKAVAGGPSLGAGLGVAKSAFAGTPALMTAGKAAGSAAWTSAQTASSFGIAA